MASHCGTGRGRAPSRRAQDLLGPIVSPQSLEMFKGRELGNKEDASDHEGGPSLAHKKNLDGTYFS